MALNELTLRKLLPNRAGLKIWNESLKLKAKNGRQCPTCSERMVKLNHTFLTNNVELDICNTCKIFWFDKGEYKEILNSLKNPAKVKEPVPSSAMSKKAKAISKTQKLDDTLTLNSDFQKLFNLPATGTSFILALVGLSLSIGGDSSSELTVYSLLTKSNLNIIAALIFIHLHQFLPNIYKFGLFGYLLSEEHLKQAEKWIYWLAWIDLISIPIYLFFKMLS